MAVDVTFHPDEKINRLLRLLIVKSESAKYQVKGYHVNNNHTIRSSIWLIFTNSLHKRVQEDTRYITPTDRVFVIDPHMLPCQPERINTKYQLEKNS